MSSNAERESGLKSDDFLQSLARGLAVIEAFGGEHPEQTLSEVAVRTGFTRAAVRRTLLTLVELGYARFDGRLFSLAPRALNLGYAYLSSLSLPEIAGPYMEQLVADVHESCSMSLLDHGDIVYVGRVPAKRIAAAPLVLGSRIPAYPTAMGRVLLACKDAVWLDAYLATVKLCPLTDKTITDPGAMRGILRQVADQGYAAVDKEVDPGVQSVAVPVRTPDGTVTFAINIARSSAAGTVQSLVDGFLGPLRETARQIEGGWHAALARRPSQVFGH